MIFAINKGISIELIYHTLYLIFLQCILLENARKSGRNYIKQNGQILAMVLQKFLILLFELFSMHL